MEIPCYNPLDVIKNIRLMILNKKIKEIHPWWYGFEGTITSIEDYYEIKGKYTYSKKYNRATITELPISSWTANYVTFLNQMVASKKIKDYNDKSGYINIYFEIDLNNDYEFDTENFEKEFKLIKKYSIKNMHLYSFNRQVRKYSNTTEIFNEYFQPRLDLYYKRRKYQLDKLQSELELVSNKVKFIYLVIEDKLKINKRGKNEISEDIEKNHKLIKINNCYDYLLHLPIYSLTKEKIDELNKKKAEKENQYQNLYKKTPENIWTEELDVLENEYNKWIKEKEKRIEEEMENEAENKAKDKKKKITKK